MSCHRKIASPFDSSDDKEEFTGFNREERALLRNASDEQDFSDNEDEISDVEEMIEDLVWDENKDDVDVPEFTQCVGPTRMRPPNSSVLDYFLLLFTTDC